MHFADARSSTSSRRAAAGGHSGEIGTHIGDYGLPNTVVNDSPLAASLELIRTRLNQFSAEEQGHLINWGYALADAAMRRWVLPGAPSAPGVQPTLRSRYHSGPARATSMTQLVPQPLTRGTHALVIGVGEYPWLDGGKQPRFAHFEGMGQLSSPPVSARAFAEWLLSPTGYHNPACPLASLDLLVSDASTDQFAPPGGTSTTIQRARFADVAAAITAWFQRGDHADDLLLFFYCGHGVARGLNMTLLPEDYGSLQTPPQMSLNVAIDFDGLYLPEWTPAPPETRSSSSMRAAWRRAC